jgi:hypothetical protein
MIQANELRIGNWFSYVLKYGVWTTKYEKVESIHDNGVNVYSSSFYDSTVIEADYEFKDINPVPLTPEILEKAGFKEYLKGIAFTNDHYVINLKEGKFFRWEVEGGYGAWFILSDYCQYVHQLQNLYFALTGEELQINL